MSQKQVLLFLFANALISATVSYFLVRGTGTPATVVVTSATSSPAEGAAVDCEDALRALCSSEKTEMDCLATHIESLPAACRPKYEAMLRTHALPECRDEIEKYCSNVKPGGGRIALCLRNSLSKLGDVCRRRIDAPIPPPPPAKKPNQ